MDSNGESVSDCMPSLALLFCFVLFDLVVNGRRMIKVSDRPEPLFAFDSQEANAAINIMCDFFALLLRV